MAEPKIFQEEMVEKLQLLFNQEEVVASWRPFVGEGRRIYQPIVDIAVGPFATEGQYIKEYNELVEDKMNLIDRWATNFQSNWNKVIGDHYFAAPPPRPANHLDFLDSSSNQNARCFMAIELENETTRKHLMGSIVNAGALGRLGLLITWQDKVLRAAIRMRQYFTFLSRVKKRTFDMSGVLILTAEQFAASLDS